MSNIITSPRRTALAIFALLLGIYLATSSGHRYAIDEEQMYGLTQAVGQRGSLALNLPSPSELPIYSTYGPGQSLAALPLYWLGGGISRFVSPEARPWLTGAITFWFNPIVTAAVAALVYLGSRRIRSHGAALVATLVYGLATMAWPYTKTFFAEPLNALLWFGSFLMLWRPGQDTARPSSFFLAGLLAGITPAVKIQAVIALPILGLYTVWLLRTSPRPWGSLWAWALGVGIPLATLAGYNTLLFGSPLTTGYGGSVFESFTTPFWEGFSGQLWGARRGLVWYAPLLLLTPLGLVALWRIDSAVAVLCGALFITQVLFYATWYAWDGAGAWGPRFLNVALPFLCLPLAALVWGRPLRAAAIALAALTVPVQVAGLAVNMNRGFLAPSAAPSQIAAHLALVAQDAERAIERHLAPERAVLLRGWSYSEGAGRSLFPRWSMPEATVVVRSAQPARVTLTANSCYVPPAPTPLTLRVNGATIAAGVPCPQRQYQLMLPAGGGQIDLGTSPWRPSDVGIDRVGELGTYVTEVSAEAAGVPLALAGDRLPNDVVPLGRQAMVSHLSDPRVATWDVWWALTPHMPLSPRDMWLVNIVWGGTTITALVTGIVLFRRPKCVNPSPKRPGSAR